MRTRACSGQDVALIELCPSGVPCCVVMYVSFSLCVSSPVRILSAFVSSAHRQKVHTFLSYANVEIVDCACNKTPLRDGPCVCIPVTLRCHSHPSLLQAPTAVPPKRDAHGKLRPTRHQQRAWQPSLRLGTAASYTSEQSWSTE